MQLRELRSDLRVTNRSAYAEGTRKNLKIQWESFLLFCIYFELVSLPATTVTLQLYAQFLSRSFKSVDSIRNYLSGVRKVHLLLGFTLDDINQFILNLSLKGLERLKGHCVKQAEPMTPELLARIYYVLDMTDANDMVYWCLFLFAFFLVARKSNLVPTVTDDISKGKCLLRKNVTVALDHLIVTMNWSKTIQCQERILVSPLLKLRGSILCPFDAYRKMIIKVKASAGDPLFLLKNGKPVSYYLFQKRLRDALEVLKIDSSLYPTHSFRRGFATFAFRNNISADEVQILGDWRSDAYKKYISLSIEDKLKIFRGLQEHFRF